jgi:hypothetical protein
MHVTDRRDREDLLTFSLHLKLPGLLPWLMNFDAWKSVMCVARQGMMRLGELRMKLDQLASLTNAMSYVEQNCFICEFSTTVRIISMICISCI